MKILFFYLSLSFKNRARSNFCGRNHFQLFPTSGLRLK